MNKPQKPPTTKELVGMYPDDQSVLRDHVLHLESRLAEAIKVIEFYADPNLWLAREQHTTEWGSFLRDDYDEILHLYNIVNYTTVLGGKRAREFLEKLK